MENRKRKFTSRKSLIFISLISLVLISAISIHMHKEALLFPGPLTENNTSGAEIEGFVSHAEFEKDCGHCHGPIHCVEDRRCQECHYEVAQDRANSTGLHGRLPGIAQCETCHTEHKGKEAHITSFAYNNVNHELLADFSLEGHHFDYNKQPMNCQSCHSQDSYISEKLDCITCHSKADHGFMATHIELFGTDCVACHNGTGHYAEFQHADVYVLDGKHQDLECEECHQEQQFSGTPAGCSDCHQEPEVHVGFFGQQCERCHTVFAWSPAELKAHTFVVDHGKKGIPSCETCHKDTYTEYLCINCHDLDEMEIVHLREEIYEFNNCIECHPSGKENEALHLKEEQAKNDLLESGNSEKLEGMDVARSTGEIQQNIPDQSGKTQKVTSNKNKIQKNTSDGRGGSK